MIVQCKVELLIHSPKQSCRSMEWITHFIPHFVKNVVTNPGWDSCHWLLVKEAHEVQTLQWRHNKHDGVSNNRRPDCLINRLFRGRSKATSKLCVTGLCAGNSPVTGEFPAQRASNAENVSIWWRHHESNIERNFLPAICNTVYWL